MRWTYVGRVGRKRTLGKRSWSSRLRRLAAGAVLATFGADAVQAGEPPARLPDLTLEQLVEVQLVSVASKRPQTSTEAPSVVTVVSGDEIRRQGYRTVGDVLRTLPGFYVSYDRNYSYVGVRGFGRPGDYNTRVLVLIDGVRTNDNVYDGAYVGHESPVDVGLIERIEISRGPGAAVYGNNAFFGVINIVTKSGGALAGGELRAGAGSFGGYEGKASYGRSLAGGASFVASASVLGSAGQTLSFPEFGGADGGTVAGGDGERARRAFASFSKGGFTAGAIHGSRTKHVPTAPFETVFGDTRALTRDTFTIASLGYERSFGKRFDWTSRLAHTAYDYDGAYPYETAPGDVSVYNDRARGRWWTLESTGVLRAGRHTLMAGGELMRNSRQDQAAEYSGLPETAFEIRDRGQRQGAFLQGDVALGSRLRLSLGGRYDHNEDFGGEASPRLALIASPDAHTTLKLLYGSSYRAPNEYEQNYYEAQRASQRSAERLTPERIRTVEAVLERGLGEHVRLTASVFSNEITDLITLQSDSPGQLVFRNTDGATSKGGELALDARLPSGTAGRLSHSYQRTRDEAGRPLSNSPAHMLKASLAVPLRSQDVWTSFDAQYVGARRTLAGVETAGFVVVNATVFAKRLKGNLEASASVYNVFDARYSDPGSEEHLQDAIRQDGRSFTVALGWRF
jgi:outer membrane receptor protein involved in Fe transport